jgi:hypothetical protein
MKISEKELTQARDTVGSLLEQLGLATYLFEVEPRADHWEVRVECAPDSGWQSSVLNVNEDWLEACRTDSQARHELLAQWRKRLAAC